jgi:uncharacterized protein (TIGR03083 family)
MTDVSTLDVGAAYRGLRRRLTTILENIEPAQWEIRLPHCPDWTVRETLAHLSGVVDDGINGNMEGVATEAWTAAQVNKRVDWSGPRILEEWNMYAPFVEERATQQGLALSQLLFDAATHEHDLRHALGRTGARDSDALWIAASFLARRLPQQLAEAQCQPICFVVDGQTLHDPGNNVSLTLRTSVFDFVRACGSRRSLRQIRALHWSSDPSPILKYMLPFAPPCEDIDEG